MQQVEAEQLLCKATGLPGATFRQGQWEAIDRVVNQRHKMLVVERTGWGKSIVYFISTRILRDRGRGPTLVISPLLALMRNQLDAAQRLGIRATTINSTNTTEWNDITQQLLLDQIDLLLISPERLSNEKFNTDVLMPISNRIGLLVIDEAHCISDWGHDFRPDYRRIVNLLKRMPSNLPVLGTTATANNRVVNDIKTQIGDIHIQRGPLKRKSLHLQTIRLNDQSERLAWLAEYIPRLPGTGIIYTLTKRDTLQVAKWLDQNGIDAKPYFSDVNDESFDNSNTYREHLEELLLSNKLKALVATTALGMGYDKPDLGFVVHYQAPGSIVGYYQQIGRAGRAIDKAYGILLSGREDEDIHAYFRDTAFPDENHVNQILAVLEKHDGLSVQRIQEHINLSHGQIEKALKLLSVENPAPVIKDRSQWKRTAVPFTIDRERINHLTRQKVLEWKEVQDYIATKGCLMQYLLNILNDPATDRCGQCSNCLGHPVIHTAIHSQLVKDAALFLKRSEMPLNLNIQVAKDAFPVYGFSGNLPQDLRAEEGRILSRWGDAGWGNVVEQNKHANHFSDELVDAVALMIRERWQPQPRPSWITCVPSFNHPDLVPDFTKRLAQRLQIEYKPVISKISQNQQQKSMQNRFYQCHNLDGVFNITGNIPENSVFLIDDIVDSKWTLTVLSALLRQNGSGPVFPIALASTSKG